MSLPKNQSKAKSEDIKGARVVLKVGPSVAMERHQAAKEVDFRSRRRRILSAGQQVESGIASF